MIEPVEKVILASASPRRRELLAQVGIDCEVIPAHVDETQWPGEAPGAHVRRLAREKAMAIDLAPDEARPVVAADTIVVVDGQVLGKPADDEDAARMLEHLSGRTHEVMTAVAVRYAGTMDDRISVTRVTMRAISPEEIRRYCASGEPRDKAGAYGIQGRAAAFVQSIEGSYTGVVGLPLHETLALLEPCGVRP